MAVKQSIRAGSQWLLVGNMGQQVFAFIIGVLLARILVPEDFGLLVTVQVFTGVASMLAGGGMGQALVREKNTNEHDFHVVFTMQLLIGISIYLFFYVLSFWFSEFFDNNIYTNLLRVSALSFIINPFLSIHINWLNKEMMFKERTIARLLVTIITSIISVWMALVGYGVWSLVVGGLVGSLIMILLVSRHTAVSPHCAFNREKLKKFATYGFKVSSNDVVTYVRKEVSNLIISKMMGAGMVGLYNKASSLSKMPFSIISTAVYQPVFREMSKSQDNLDKNRYLFYKMVSVLILYTLPFYIGLSFLGDVFVVLVYGENWRFAGELLRILSIAGLFFCIGHPCGAVLAAHNRLGRELLVHISTMLIVVIVTIYGLKWGIKGVAWGIVFSELFSTVFMFYLVSRTINTSFTELIKNIFPPLKLNLILIFVLTLFNFLYFENVILNNMVVYLLVSIFIGSLVYFVSFLFIDIESLSSEAQKWRDKISLIMNNKQ